MEEIVLGGTIYVCAEDFDRIVADLQQPRPPSPAMVEAAALYKKLLRDREAKS